MLASGQIVDRYEVQSLLGQGGMAAVYRVRHTRLEVDRALKIVTITHPGVRQRLLQEGRVQASLSHPNVVGVTDVIEVVGQPGLLMEYVAGPSMQEWLQRYSPSLDEALTLFREIAAGVSYAHNRDLIHRDLKPANVMILRRGKVLVPKVADFGLAKVMADELGDHGATRTGMGMGTPAYMAPEQVRDAKRVDKRADIFALGCLLYELTTGARAFAADDLLSLLSAVAAGRYRPPLDIRPDLPSSVDEAIRGALEVDPQERFASCEELLQALPDTGPVTWSDQALAAAAPPPEQPLPQSLPSSSGTWVGHGTLAPTDTNGAAGTWAPTPDMLGEGTLSSTPTGGVPDTTSQPDTSAEPIQASNNRIPMWIPAALGLVAIIALGSWWNSQQQRQDTDTAPTTTQPVATQPSTTRVTQPEQALVADPDLSEAVEQGDAGNAVEQPVEEPAQAAAPTTSPTPSQSSSGSTSSAPSTTAPSTTAPSTTAPVSTMPAVETGTVRVTGDAESVQLRGSSGSFGPGSVPPGTYEIIATFPGRDPAAAGQVTIPPGKEVVLRCTAAFVKCVQ